MSCFTTSRDTVVVSCGYVVQRVSTKARTPAGTKATTQNIVRPRTALVCTKPFTELNPMMSKGCVAGPGSTFAAKATRPAASAALPKVATVSVTKPPPSDVHTRSPALTNDDASRYDAISRCGTAVAAASAALDNGPDGATNR